MSSYSDKIDIFPVKVDSPASVKRLPRCPNFQDIFLKSRVFAFIVYLTQEIVWYKKLDWNPRYMKHFLDTGNYIRPTPSICEKPWNWAARRLRRDIGDSVRKNIDHRTCFKYNLNFFLVKSCFTTGQRIVEPGTVHLYQIGAVQMRFFFLTNLNKKRVKKINKLFPEDQQFLYSKRILFSNEVYAIPENTRYILYATNKSFFSLHIVNAGAVNQLGFTTKNPLTELPKASIPKFLQQPQTIEEIREDTEEDEEDNSPVLLQLESGDKITERMMVISPPVATIPIHKLIQLTTPNITEWYNAMFKYQQYGDPRVPHVPSSENISPLDLSMKTSAPTIFPAATPSTSTQVLATPTLFPDVTSSSTSTQVLATPTLFPDVTPSSTSTQVPAATPTLFPDVTPSSTSTQVLFPAALPTSIPTVFPSAAPPVVFPASTSAVEWTPSNEPGIPAVWSEPMDIAGAETVDLQPVSGEEEETIVPVTGGEPSGTTVVEELPLPDFFSFDNLIEMDDEAHDQTAEAELFRAFGY